MASYDGIEIRERAIHVTGAEAALEWTIVAAEGPEWVVFDGVDVFTFDNEPRRCGPTGNEAPGDELASAQPDLRGPSSTRLQPRPAT